MSLEFGTEGDAQIATGVAGWHWLIEFYFDSATAYMTTSTLPRQWGGQTYIAAPALSVQAIRESEDAGAQEIQLSVPITDTINLAAFVGPSSAYRGKKLKLRLQLYSDTFQPVGDPVYRGTWAMQPVRVERGGGQILLPCVRAGWDRARTSDGLRHTHQQQISRYPSDRGLSYLQGLIEQPVLWLSKAFQKA